MEGGSNRLPHRRCRSAGSPRPAGCTTGSVHHGPFLVKDLLIDCAGERWFRRLADAEPSQNVGNWQWVAGVGTDAPYFRTFNLTGSWKFDGSATTSAAGSSSWSVSTRRSTHRGGRPDRPRHRPASSSATRPNPIVDHAFAASNLTAYKRALAKSSLRTEPDPAGKPADAAPESRPLGPGLRQLRAKPRKAAEHRGPLGPDQDSWRRKPRQSGASRTFETDWTAEGRPRGKQPPHASWPRVDSGLDGLAARVSLSWRPSEIDLLPHEIGLLRGR